MSRRKESAEAPKCKTCKGNKKVEVCDNCYPDGTKQIMQQIDTYPKLIHCINCGKGKPKEIPCPDCQALKEKQDAH